MNYDFHTLHDNDFESLCNDLIEVVENVRFERFKKGRDGGIDGRHKFGNKQIILQAKHFLKSGYAKLLTQLKKEGKKLKKIDCSRYIVCTSVGLTPMNKDKILKAMHPYIKSTADIYGQDELNSLISKNSSIEKKYYQLWIGSINVMQSVINNGIVERSNDFMEEVIASTKHFVMHESYTKGIKKINQNKILLITGEPGVGKTILAKAIVATLFRFNGCNDFIEMSTIEDGEKMWNREVDKKQVFFYDDFLGSNTLELVDKKDAAIHRFLNRISRSKNKYFIMTSRLHIVEQGVSVGSKMNTFGIRNNEHFLKVSNLSQLDKAMILYNHLYKAMIERTIEDKQLAFFYEDKRYYKIIEHKNFNPRIIEYITRFPNLNGGNYGDFVFKQLNNPINIRDSSYKNALSDLGRTLVAAVVYNNGKISEMELRNVYNNYKKQDGGYGTFEDEIKILVKSFLNPVKLNKKQIFNLFNPSISDYIFNQYNGETETLKKIYNLLYTTDSLSLLTGLSRSYEIQISDILLHLYSKIYTKENYEYFMKLCNELFINIDLKKLKGIDIQILCDTLVGDIDSAPFNDLMLYLTFFEYNYSNKIIKDKVLISLIPKFLNSDNLYDVEEIVIFYDTFIELNIEEDVYKGIIDERIIEFTDHSYLVDLCIEELSDKIYGNYDVDYEYLQNGNFNQDLLDYTKQKIESYSSAGLDASNIAYDAVNNSDISAIFNERYGNIDYSNEDSKDSLSYNSTDEYSIDETFGTFDDLIKLRS